MIITITTPFVGEVCGRTFNMPAVGTELDVTEKQAQALISMGVAHAYETKVQPFPDEIKKKSELSGSSRLAHRLRFKTRKN